MKHHPYEADELKNNYENSHEAAKQPSIPTKTKKVKESPFQKLQRLPDGCHPDFDNDHLYSINQLQKFRRKSHGSVLVDDKECVMRIILFTMAVLPDVRQPFLIITTPASLSLWEVQFNKFTPHINVVVYDGGKDMLKLIEDQGFYENGNHTMSQVLLSHPDAILEDIEPIARIGWEAVIVDYHQNSALKYLEQLKQLSTDFRVLLLSSPIKDNLPEYMNLLAFLNSGEKDNSNYVDTADALEMSKLRFTRHIAYERKSDSSNFLEHWVPAYISQVQLEIYCSILLSNSSVLQSQMKTDSAEALRDILLSLSKCCNHPYLLDECLQTSLINNHDLTETIDTRVHASGKLLLLDKMLKEISKKRLRVVILFQDTVNLLVKQFFEYLLENDLVVREPKGMMHAFNIALVHHRESLALAEKCLNYECNKELAGSMYGKLRTLKKKFLHKVGETSSKCQPMSVKNTELQWQETSTNLRNDHMFLKRAMDLHGNFTNGAPQEDSSGAEQMVSEGQELISIQENQRECHVLIDELPIMVVEKRIDLVDNVCSFREKNILHKQQLEISSDLETHTQNKRIPRFGATQTCESSMHAQQCTSLPAQQSLATLRHPPADATSRYSWHGGTSGFAG